MEIPLVYFRHFYFVIFGLFVLFTGFNLYHLFRFGFKHYRVALMIFLYVSATVILLFYANEYAQTVDWSDSLVISNIGFDWPG